MTDEDTSEEIAWSEVIDWECDTNPDREMLPWSDVMYTRTIGPSSFCDEVEVDTTVVIIVYQNDTVVVQEIRENLSSPVARVSCSDAEDKVQTVESIATVYDDGREGMQDWLYNRVEERTAQLESTFSSVEEITVDETYGLTFVVTDELDDTFRMILESYSSEPVFVPTVHDSEPAIRIEGDAPVSL